jgi:hypothetical protein
LHKNSAEKFKVKLSLRGIWCYERIILQWISKEKDEGVIRMNVFMMKDQLGIPSEIQTKLWVP